MHCHRIVVDMVGVTELTLTLCSNSLASYGVLRLPCATAWFWMAREFGRSPVRASIILPRTAGLKPASVTKQQPHKNDNRFMPHSQSTGGKRSRQHTQYQRYYFRASPSPHQILRPLHPYHVLPCLSPTARRQTTHTSCLNTRL